MGLGEGEGLCAGPGASPIQQPLPHCPPDCSSSLAGSQPARLSALKWTAALNSQPSPLEGAFVSPLFLLSPQRSGHSGPLLSLPQALLSFLEGKLGAPRESRWPKPCEELSWLYGSVLVLGDRPTGGTVCPPLENDGGGIAHLLSIH